MTSEFGASGCVGGYNHIDELDTLRNGGVIPEPATGSLLALGLLVLTAARRARR